MTHRRRRSDDDDDDDCDNGVDCDMMMRVMKLIMITMMIAKILH